jgi:hypothetical protein
MLRYKTNFFTRATTAVMPTYVVIESSNNMMVVIGMIPMVVNMLPIRSMLTYNLPMSGIDPPLDPQTHTGILMDPRDARDEQKDAVVTRANGLLLLPASPSPSLCAASSGVGPADSIAS